jgi:hypothetical protein
LSQSHRIQVRHTAPSWWGVSIVDCHDRIRPVERPRVASTHVLIKFHASGEEPQDHEILNHVAVIKLVLDGIRKVRAGPLKESLKVVYRWPHLALVAVCCSHDMPHVGAVCFLIIAAVIVGRGRNPLRTLLAPLPAALGSLLGLIDGDIK